MLLRAEETFYHTFICFLSTGSEHRVIKVTHGRNPFNETYINDYGSKISGN